MYVNRKKRSVKWIHDDGHEEERFVEGERVCDSYANAFKQNFNSMIHLFAQSKMSGMRTASFRRACNSNTRSFHRRKMSRGKFRSNC